MGSHHPTADAAPTEDSIRLGAGVRTEDIDVWRVEDRGDARIQAIVLTHRLRLPDSEAPSPELASPSDVLAPVDDPVVIDHAAETARVRPAVARLLEVLAHGGPAAPERPRVGAQSV